MEVDVQERMERLKVVAIEIDGLVRELGPKWIRLAHLRTEAQAILKELEARERPGQ